MPNQSPILWDNPVYAWQQQLASGANLAKNLDASTLLGLTLGTGLGNWLGYKFGNWQRTRDENAQYGNKNPSPTSPALQNILAQRGDFDLGWKPQYRFPTAEELFKRAMPKRQDWDWRQFSRQQQPFFPMTPTKDFLSNLPEVPVPFYNGG